MNTKYLTLLFIVVLLSHCSISAQDFWEELYFPDSTNIFDLAVNDQGHIFVGAGKNNGTGGIYRSTDTAQSWDFLGMPEKTFYSLAIDESGAVYAGASQGPWFSGLFRSTDNGESWNAILPDIGVHGNIMKILPMGDTIFVSIWMAGIRLLRTTNYAENWELVYSVEGSNEYISDIAMSNSGELYFTVMCYMYNTGGLYKSIDLGETCEFIGLLNHQVLTLEFNEYDDLFIGVWSDFVYMMGSMHAIYHDNGEIEDLFFGPSITDIVINDEGTIFATYFPGGVYRSMDNGETFTKFNEGFEGGTGILAIDGEGYLYSASFYSSSKLYKTIETTITSTSNERNKPANKLNIYPNPVSEHLFLKIPEEYEDGSSMVINIYDISGKRIKTYREFTTDDISYLEVTNFIPGIYMIELLAKEKRTTNMFVKN